MLEYGKAKDRARLAKKGNSLCKRGWIVVYERFPIKRLFDYPNTLAELKENGSKKYGEEMVLSILKRIDEVIESIPEPDLFVLISVDQHIMQKIRFLLLKKQ